MRNSAVLSLAAIAAGVIAGGHCAVHASSTRVAFTATALSKSLDASGTETLVTTKIIAVRSDGSKAITKRDVDPRKRTYSARETHEIHDVANRQHVEIHPAVKAKITFKMDDATAARLTASPESDCDTARGDIEVRPVPAGILSIPVVQRTMTTTLPNGQTLTREEWLAPALQCLPLRMSAVLRDSGGMVLGRNTEEVSEILLGEPDKSVFEVPASFTEHSPSEVMAAESAARGEECARCTSPPIAAADSAYSIRHK